MKNFIIFMWVIFAAFFLFPIAVSYTHLCGCIKDEVLDVPTLAMELIGVLAENYPQMLKERYKLEETAETPLENMESIAVKRGCILPGKRIDYERIGRIVLDEFRGGKIGRITLENPGQSK